MNNDLIWKDDKLARQGDADFLEQFLRRNSEDLVKRSIARSYVLNLDASWGRGKTFFLNHFKTQLESSGHLVAFVNAWQDDFADDPLTAVMAAIDDVVASNTKRNSPVAKSWKVARSVAGKVAVQAGKGLVIKGLGVLITEGAAAGLVGGLSVDDARTASTALSSQTTSALEKLIDDKMQSVVSDFVASRELVSQFRSKLADFVAKLTENEKSPPFFVFVDELDRCRPAYAIAMLERIKHLFEIPSVVFVIATDSDQLSEAVRGVYGAGFDGPRYLRRFFDSRFEFAPPSLQAMVDFLFETEPLDSAKLEAPIGLDQKWFIANFFFHADVDTRTVKQIYATLRNIVIVWPYKVPLQLLIMLPILLASFIDRNTARNPVEETTFLRLIRGNFLARRKTIDQFGRQTGEQEENIISLAAAFWRVAQGDLPSLLVNDAIDPWLREVFQREFAVLHNNSVRSDQPKPRSLILSYPSIARQAGRVSD